MIHKIKYILPVIAILLNTSCADEDKQPFDDFQKGSIPLFVQGGADTGFIDLSDFNSSRINFSLATEGEADVSGVDIIITYNNSVTRTSSTATYTTLTSFPADVSITFEQLISAFPSNVVTADSLDLGDSFVIGGNVVTTDGRYLDGGYSPSVLANKQVLLTYNVACASDLAGTYDLTLLSGVEGEEESMLNQTIVQRAAGYYEISDVSMALFGATAIKYRFTDICGSLTADPQSVEFAINVSLAGSSVDPETGEITFRVEYVNPSCCGVTGIVTVFKATPK
jgi:hypothetical protein